MKKFLTTFVLCFAVGTVHAANNCTGATYYDADTDVCVACPAGYDYNTEPGKDDITDCQIHCDGGTYGGYTELQYIQTTSTLTYIDTEIVPTNYNWSAEFKVAWPQANASGLFGLSGTNVLRQTPPSYRFVFGLGGNTYATVWGGAVAVSDWNTLGIRYKANVFHTFKVTKNGIYVNDVLKSEISNPVDWNGNTLSFYVGALNSPNGAFSGAANAKWGYAKIWNNDGVLVFDGIPARRDSDDAVGMYDRITGKFFPSEGNGTFTAGPVVQGFCASAGAGYWAAAQTVNYGSVGLRTACPIGTYSDVVNAASAAMCTDCVGATYNNEPAAVACKACPTGYIHNTTAGKTSINQCQIHCDGGTYVYNQNLLNNSFMDNSTYGDVTVNGVTTARAKILPTENGNTYTLSATLIPTGTYYYYLKEINPDGTVLNQQCSSMWNNYNATNANDTVKKTCTFTTRNNATYLVYFATAASSNNLTLTEYQMEEGSTATAYQPYNPNPVCADVGAGYWAAASTVNYGSVGTRNACPAGLSTVGYGHGADSADDCARTLHIGDNIVYMRQDKVTTPALNIRMENGDVFYVNLSPTNHNMSKLHFWYNGNEYTAYDDSLYYGERDFETGAQITPIGQ